MNFIFISSAGFIGAECDANDLFGEYLLDYCDLVGENLSLSSGEHTPHFGGGDCSMKH